MIDRRQDAATDLICKIEVHHPAPTFEFRSRNPAAFVQESADVILGPAVRGYRRRHVGIEQDERMPVTVGRAGEPPIAAYGGAEHVAERRERDGGIAIVAPEVEKGGTGRDDPLHRHAAFVRSEPLLFPVGRPAQIAQPGLIFRDRNAEIIADRGIVRHARRNAMAGDIAGIKAEEAPYGRVRAPTAGAHAMLGIEIQFARDGSGHCQQHLPRGRRALVLQPKGRIADDLRRRRQDRHIFRPTPRHHAIDGHVPDRRLVPCRKQSAQHFVGCAGREGQEGLHPFKRGWNDGQTIAPAHAFDMILHGVQRPSEHDLPRGRVLNRLRCRDAAGLQPGNDRIGQIIRHLPAEQNLAVRFDIAGIDRHGRARDIQIFGDGGCLIDERRADDRHGRDARALDRDMGAQDRRRATAAIGDAQYRRIHAPALELIAQTGDHGVFIGPMNVAELGIGNDRDVGISTFQFFANDRKCDVASPHPGPDFGDGLA
ncbi:MAG: hypothetical protein DI606_15520 [Sphingobium sp.]|nr:MAG: hypothetical protein DI606_15520 [Sphingobium sp.]